MKKGIIIISILISNILFSQSIYKSSLDSGGASTAVGNIQILYTIGEVNVQELSVGNIILSEGFISKQLQLFIKINPISYLQGTYINPNEVGLMNDALRTASLIPTTSPYADLVTAASSVFNLGGTSGLGAIDDDIVDWVWVELRDENDNTAIIDSQSALLQRDGDIVDVDGVSALNFDQLAGNYYVAIAHRNHLGIITANTVSLSSSVTVLDLTSDSNLILGGGNAVVIVNGKLNLISGDYDGNGQIQNSDLTQVTTLLGTSGYSDADADMNSQIQNADINNIINPNIGNGEQTRSTNQPIITAPLSAFHKSKKQ